MCLKYPPLALSAKEDMKARMGVESEAHPSSCQKHVYKIMLIERILQGTGARLYWKTLGATVEDYIDHPESKFSNGHISGPMRRRHVNITSDEIVHIGKESDELEENEVLGVTESAYVEYAGMI
jgi:hypothetical protein